MQDSIQRRFLHDILESDVQEGRYDLFGPDGIIRPQDWEKTVKIGMSIKSRCNQSNLEAEAIARGGSNTPNTEEPGEGSGRTFVPNVFEFFDNKAKGGRGAYDTTGAPRPPPRPQPR